MKLTELLANYAHKQWTGWMNHLFAQCTERQDGALIIPEYYVRRWKRQMETDYDCLPDNEKESDRREAEGMINVIEEEQKSRIQEIFCKEEKPDKSIKGPGVHVFSEGYGRRPDPPPASPEKIYDDQGRRIDPNPALIPDPESEEGKEISKGSIKITQGGI